MNKKHIIFFVFDAFTLLDKGLDLGNLFFLFKFAARKMADYCPSMAS
jgi:hypothetical protein